MAAIRAQQRLGLQEISSRSGPTDYNYETTVAQPLPAMLAVRTQRWKMGDSLGKIWSVLALAEQSPVIRVPLLEKATETLQGGSLEPAALEVGGRVLLRLLQQESVIPTHEFNSARERDVYVADRTATFVAACTTLETLAKQCPDQLLQQGAAGVLDRSIVVLDSFMGTAPAVLAALKVLHRLCADLHCKKSMIMRKLDGMLIQVCQRHIQDRSDGVADMVSRLQARLYGEKVHIGRMMRRKPKTGAELHMGSRARGHTAEGFRQRMSLRPWQAEALTPRAGGA
mmetsp:Transcript_28347/g.73313  ORF Transcript_28347/g.73313 Transcript_28347/m.73313 type:complete len:284 (-) Transcript_28347:120-971(-)